MKHMVDLSKHKLAERSEGVPEADACMAESTTLSIVVPVFNEEANIKPFFAALKELEGKLPNTQFEFIFVDDGSRDTSYQLLQEISSGQENVRVLKFAKNYGMEAAVMAGFLESTGDCAVFLGCDFQEHPSMVIDLFHLWKQGFPIVWAARSKIEGQSQLQRFFPNIYWRMVNFITGGMFPKLGVDTALMDRSALSVLTAQAHRDAPLLLMISETGFKSTIFSYVKAARLRGSSGWTLDKKLALVLRTILFNPKPIRVLMFATVAVSLLGIVGSMAMACIDLTAGNDRGFTALVLFAVSLLSLLHSTAFWLYVEYWFLDVKRSYVQRFIIQERINGCKSKQNQGLPVA